MSEMVNSYVFFMRAISFWDSIGFYNSSSALPVGADYLLGCKIVTVTGYDFVPWIFSTNFIIGTF